MRNTKQKKNNIKNNKRKGQKQHNKSNQQSRNKSVNRWAKYYDKYSKIGKQEKKEERNVWGNIARCLIISLCISIMVLQVLQISTNVRTIYNIQMEEKKLSFAISKQEKKAILIHSKEQKQINIRDTKQTILEDFVKVWEEFKEQENKKLTLEEMRQNPWTPTVEFLPYLQGSYERNLELLAKLIYVEARDGKDIVQQLQGLVAVARAFHPYSFSDGTGNLESVIFWENQYPWAKYGIDNIVPDEQSYRNAEAVLTGNLLDNDIIKNVTRNVEYANTARLGYKNYVAIPEINGETVYFDYGW